MSRSRRDDAAALAESINSTIARPARLYDYLLDGQANFAVDRAAVDRATAGQASGYAVLRAAALAPHVFGARAASWLVTAAIRQFLVVGAGVPRGDDDIHHVAQRSAPESRVVYVDDDPIVLAYAHILRRGTPEGASVFVLADLCDPAHIVKESAATLDLAVPTAVILLNILQFIPADRDPGWILSRLLDTMPSGSYLAICHLASDLTETAKLVERLSDATHETWTLRSRAEIEDLFDGLELVEPGVVLADRWGLEDDHATSATPDGGVSPVWAGVGRKP